MGFLVFQNLSATNECDIWAGFYFLLKKILYFNSNQFIKYDILKVIIKFFISLFTSKHFPNPNNLQTKLALSYKIKI